MDQIKIGKFISQLRLENNMTQEELASKLGVSNRSVSRWENGKNMPDLSLFEPICELFDITVEEFLLGERIPKTDEASVDVDAIINEYIETKNQKRRTHINRFSVVSIVLFLLITIGCLIASFLTNSVVQESVLFNDWLHYDIAYILFNLAKASGIIFILLLVSYIVCKKLKNNIMSIILALCFSAFIVFGVGFTIFVEANYTYDEPYFYYVDEKSGFKTDQHNPYEEDMKYYPFHNKMVKYAQENDGDIESIIDNTTEFNYIGYELFGTRLIWTNEYPWTDGDEYINYWMEYYCVDNVLSKAFLMSFYSITMASNDWVLIDENDEYSLYEHDGDYMITFISSDDLLMQRVSSAKSLGISKDEIITSAKTIYQNEHAKIFN